LYLSLIFVLGSTISCASQKPDVLKISDNILAMKVVDWPDGVQAGFVKSPHSRTPVLRIEIDNTSNAAKTVAFTESPTWGTPIYYVGKGSAFSAVSFKARATGILDKAELQFCFTDANGALIKSSPITLNNQLQRTEITRTLLDAAGSINWSKVNAPGFTITVHANSKAIFEVADTNIKYTDGETYNFLSNKPYSKFYTGPKQKSSPVFSPLPKGNTLYMGGTFGAPSIETLKLIKRLLPEYNICSAPCFAWDLDISKKFVEQCRENGFFVQLQKAGLRGVAQLTAASDSLGLRWDGKGDETKNELAFQLLNNGLSCCSDSIRNQLGQEIGWAAALGINNFKQVDYVLPWDGRWGYDRATLSEIRRVLAGEDAGLPLKNGKRVKAVHFWEYFAAYRGMKFAPGDLGFQNWNEYIPTTEKEVSRSKSLIKQRNLAVFLAFQHYEWLKTANSMGKNAKRFGGAQAYTLNPEDLANGGDYIYLSKLADAGEPFYEFFGNPLVTSSAYYNMPMYLRNARKNDSRVGIILEVGAGGHGQPYMDPLLTWLTSYDLVSNGFNDYHNEWMDEAPYSLMTDPSNKYHYDRFLTWLSGAYGYDRSQKDAPNHPKTDVFSISIRSAAHYMDAWVTNIKQMDSMAQYLRDEYINFEQTDQVCYPDILKDARVIFYTAPYIKSKMTNDINHWLSDGNHVLVTHSYIPFSKDRGAVTDFIDNMSEPIDSGKIMEPVKIFLGTGKRDTEMVMYRGEMYSYEDYLDPVRNSISGTSELTGFKHIAYTIHSQSGEVKSSDPTFSSLSGQHLDIHRYFEVPLVGKTLVGIGDKPLVTELCFGSSKIIYLHCRPSDLPIGIADTIAAAIAKYADLPQMALKGQGKYYLHRYELKNGSQAVVVWDRNSLASFGPECGGYTPNMDKLRIKYSVPEAHIDTVVPSGKPGKYIVYSYLNGSRQNIDSEDGNITLKADSVSGELFYIIPDDTNAVNILADIETSHEKLNVALKGKISVN